MSAQCFSEQNNAVDDRFKNNFLNVKWATIVRGPYKLLIQVSQAISKTAKAHSNVLKTLMLPLPVQTIMTLFEKT